MSVITLNRAIVPALWPNDLARIASCRYDRQVGFSWRHVPETRDELFEWAFIVEDSSPQARSGQRHLVYSPEVADPMWNVVEDDNNCDVVIILHGFLNSGDLSALGNWSKRANNAASARHTLVLTSAGCTEPFQAQKNALGNLTEHVELKAGAVHLPDFGNRDELKLEHQVFTKVRDPSSAEKPAARGEDISAYLREHDMYHTWALDPLPVYIRRPMGKESPISPTALRRGDFLEVAVKADIQRLRRNGKTATSLAFPIIRIVRLLPAADAQKLLPPTASATTSPHPTFFLPPT
ncbi:hypothetical protein LXA43DRAFT_1093151 [Ganoderma leucocontextum]|nr:hypothetical protein LXA43DRAFT_1093151 [Ganoderma leucocontextum]